MFTLDDGRSTVFALVMNGSGVSTVNYYRPIWNNLATALSFGNERLDVTKLLPLKASEAP
jgi:hypothetical protein